MKGKERNSAFFSNQKAKPSVSLHNRFKSARVQGTLNMSSSMPPLTEIPIEVFDLEKYIEEGEKFWEFEPLKSLDMSFNKITMIPSDISNLIDCISIKFRDNLIEEIPSSFYEGCVNIKHLDFSSNKISNLNERINNLIYLKDLLLSNNKLQSIPNELITCRSIVTLDLDHNKIMNLPEIKWNMNNLITLNISYNMLTILPYSISNITTLEILNCSHNNISILPDLSQLTSLRILDASQNKLHEFPILSTNNIKTKLSHLILGYNNISMINITTLINQKELNELLIHNNQLIEIPKEIEYLTKLKIIDISNNNLRDLPANLGYMTQLQHIKAEGNPIKVIRQHILVKSTQELKKHLCTRGLSLIEAAPLDMLTSQLSDTVLSVSSQILSQSPIYDKDIGNIDNYKVGGGIQKQHCTSGSSSSSTTSAAANNTTPSTIILNQATIAAAQSQLSDQIDFRIRDMTGTVLDMSNLSLTTLPVNFIDQVLTVPLGLTLITLNLSNNNLTTLPIIVNNLTTLRILNLTSNKLGTCSSEIISICSLPHITSIDISKNDLTHNILQLLLLGGKRTPQLMELIANNNPLRRVPLELSYHYNMKTIRLCYCQLTTLDDIDFTVLLSLVTLDVSNNKIATLPGSIYSSITLEYLSIENNELKEVPLELGAMPKLKSLLIAGNPQRTVRTNILQQGSSKVIEWLRSRLPVPIAAVKSTITSTTAAATDRNTHLQSERIHDSHCQDIGYNYSDLLPRHHYQQQQPYETTTSASSNHTSHSYSEYGNSSSSSSVRHNNTELPRQQPPQQRPSGISRRRVPTQPPPPFATSSATTSATNTIPPPAATSRDDYTTMRAEMQYATESSAYRAYENDHYTTRQQPQHNAVTSYTNTRQQQTGGSLYPEDSRGSRQDPRFLRQETAFVPAVAPTTSRYARAGAGGSSMGALLGGGGSEQGNNNQARRGQISRYKFLSVYTEL